MTHHHLFVYGTLRRSLQKPLEQFLPWGVHYLATGFGQGELYDLGDYPAMVAGNQQVTGEIYQLDDDPALFAQLDHYEGCDANALPPAEYRRELMAITTETGATLSCWVYLYNLPITAQIPIPHGDYARYLQEKTGQ